jgi:hypothetical protein
VILLSQIKIYRGLSDIIWPETSKWNKCLVTFLHKMEDLEWGKWNNLTLNAQPETPTRVK